MPDLIDQEFERECPQCGHKRQMFCYTTATPEQWIESRDRNPHFEICRNCNSGRRTGKYIWRYIGPAGPDAPKY
jgi:hypothetical protein